MVAFIICRMVVGIVDNMCIIVISSVILDIRIDTSVLFYLAVSIITYIDIIIRFLGSVAIDVSILSLLLVLLWLLLLIFTIVTTMLTNISLIICNITIFLCRTLTITIILFILFWVLVFILELYWIFCVLGCYWISFASSISASTTISANIWYLYSTGLYMLVLVLVLVVVDGGTLGVFVSVIFCGMCGMDGVWFVFVFGLGFGEGWMWVGFLHWFCGWLSTVLYMDAWGWSFVGWSGS